MSKSKFIEDQDRLDYKKRLADFMQEINPKPTLEQIERLREQLLSSRRGGVVNGLDESNH